MPDNKPLSDGISQTSSFEKTDENCFCDKKQCLLGIASIAIGLGGLTLALIL